MGFNSLSVLGRLGRDSELKVTSNGKVLTTFSLANDVGFGDKKKTIWFDVTLFGERWKKFSHYLKKGTEVVVQGEVSLYEPTDTTKKSRLQIAADKCEMAGGGGGDGAKSHGYSKDKGGARNEDEDVPF